MSPPTSTVSLSGHAARLAGTFTAAHSAAKFQRDRDCSVNAAAVGLSKYEFNKDLKCTDAYLYRQMGKDEMYARVGSPARSASHSSTSLVT